MTHSNVHAITPEIGEIFSDTPDEPNSTITPSGTTPEEQINHICKYIEFSRNIVLEEGSLQLCISTLEGDGGHLQLLSILEMNRFLSVLSENGLELSGVLPSASKENQKFYFPHAGDHPILVISSKA